MKKYFYILLLLASPSCYSIEISNFKSGLICGIDKDVMGWVCFEQEEVKITGQSTCQSGSEVFRCTWYGYSFEYDEAEEGQKISCSYDYSHPVRDVNLEHQSEELSSTGEFEFSLDEKKGYFINPQYSALSIVEEGEDKIIQDVVCSSKGKKLYSYRFMSIRPTK